jgi:hypothetical protein
MQNTDWHFDIVPKDDSENDALRPKSHEDLTDEFGIRTAFVVLCVALFIAAAWFMTAPSFEKCSALQNVSERNACYDELRHDLFKPPAKGAYLGVHDMPASGRRFVQKVDGYEATFVAGTQIFDRGEHAGALPGRLVRDGQVGATLAAAE